MTTSSDMASCTSNAGVRRKSTFSFISRDGSKLCIVALNIWRLTSGWARSRIDTSVSGRFGAEASLPPRATANQKTVTIATRTTAHTKSGFLRVDLLLDIAILQSTNHSTSHYQQCNDAKRSGRSRVIVPGTLGTTRSKSPRRIIPRAEHVVRGRKSPLPHQRNRGTKVATDKCYGKLTP